MNNNFAPTKMISKLADEEVKLGIHYHIKQAQNVTSIEMHAETVNANFGSAVGPLSPTIVTEHVNDIKAQLVGLSPDDVVRTLNDLRAFFIKQLCRAQHSRLIPAIRNSRSLLEAIREIETEMAFG